MVERTERGSPGYKPDFDIDYEVGRTAELWVSDLRAGLQNASVEVKHDTKAMKTGNLYLEYECLRQGKWMPSGIAASKALYWVFVVEHPHKAIVLSSEFLHKALERQLQIPAMRREEKDGSHPTRGVLLPLVWLMRPA